MPLAAPCPARAGTASPDLVVQNSVRAGFSGQVARPADPSSYLSHRPSPFHSAALAGSIRRGNTLLHLPAGTREASQPGPGLTSSEIRGRPPTPSCVAHACVHRPLSRCLAFKSRISRTLPLRLLNTRLHPQARARRLVRVLGGDGPLARAGILYPPSHVCVGRRRRDRVHTASRALLLISRHYCSPRAQHAGW